MNRSRFLDLFLALSLLGGGLLGACMAREETAAAEKSVPAQEAQPDPDAEPDARAVIERFVAVTKQKDGLARTSSRHDVGKVEVMGITGKAESWSRKPDEQKVVLDLGAGFGQMVSGYDGKVAWMSVELMGARLLSGMDLLHTRLESVWDAALKPAPLYETMQNLGRATFEGKECWKLELVARPLADMDAEATREARTIIEYYELESGLLLGAEGRQEGELASGPFTRIYSDYRDFGGQLLAGTTRARQGGVEMIMTIESVDFDTAGEADFALPPEVQGLLETPAVAAPK